MITKMITNVMTMCPGCEKCQNFEVEQETIWTDDKIADHLIYCKHIRICQDAVDIWKEYKEKQNVQ